MTKHFMAFLVATLITLTVSAGLLIVGGAALFNQNGTVVDNSVAPGSVNVSAPVSADASAQAQEIARLQNLVVQYQSREKEYQARELQYQQELSSANKQLEQVQMLLSELQRRGLITVSDGHIYIN